jgi:glycerophosphoryl diester phosphodiesterase
LVLLVGAESSTRWLTEKGITEAKRFVQGIAPAKTLLDKNLVMQAHFHGITITPYTFRSSSTGRFKTVREEMAYYLYDLGVDALFTDNPDLFPQSSVG